MEQNNKSVRVQSLRKKSDFLRLRLDGKRVRSTSWLLLNYLPNQEGILRVGYTIPGKTAGSVVRNRLKRWGREFFRSKLTENVAKGLDLNVVISGQDKNKIREIRHEDFQRNLESAFRSVSNAVR